MQEASYPFPAKVRVQLVKERLNEPKFAVKNSDDVRRLLSQFYSLQDREVLLCIHLDSSGHVIGIETVTIGLLNSSQFHPREVLKGAILSNAANIIMCHNHPSGNSNPSSEDINVTDQLKNACSIMGIGLLDHLIFAGTDVYSIIHHQ